MNEPPLSLASLMNGLPCGEGVCFQFLHGERTHHAGLESLSFCFWAVFLLRDVNMRSRLEEIVPSRPPPNFLVGTFGAPLLAAETSMGLD